MGAETQKVKLCDELLNLLHDGQFIDSMAAMDKSLH